MKKTILILTIIAMTASLAVAGTLAWFTGESSVANTFTAGSVSVAILEDNGNGEGPIEMEGDGLEFSDFIPGDSEQKEVSFKNTGSSKAYVRAKVTPSWTTTKTDEFGNQLVLESDNVAIDYNTSDWVLREDNYYYYKEVLNKDDVTTSLFTNVAFEPGDGDNDNDYQGATLTVSVEVEAIQAENGAAADAWEEFPFASDEENEEEE